MVSVRMGEQDGRFFLLVEGHAGAAPKGRDVVCAAVSMLAQTAVQEAVNYAAMYDGESFCILTAEMGDGFLRLDTEAKGAAAEAWRCAMHLVATGMEMLKEYHTEHVKFSWVEKKNAVC